MYIFLQSTLGCYAQPGPQGPTLVLKPGKSLEFAKCIPGPGKGLEFSKICQMLTKRYGISTNSLEKFMYKFKKSDAYFDDRHANLHKQIKANKL